MGELHKSCFDRCNLGQLALERVQAHGGDGLIGFHRIADGESLAGACNFIDLAELPPGVSIGLHRHAQDEEEFYLVLAGMGTILRDGVASRVQAGDLIRNPPGGRHSLRNDGEDLLRIFVFEVSVRS